MRGCNFFLKLYCLCYNVLFTAFFYSFMFPFITIFGKVAPVYGLLIAVGLLVANTILYIAIIKKENMLFEDFIIFEAYLYLFGFLGAKILYIIISLYQQGFSVLANISSLLALMQGGFVFYGGIFGGLFGMYLVKKIHRIDVLLYLKKSLFVLPLVHSFGRMGCFCAGCCYGVEYNGVCSIVFPKGAIAPPHVPLFPVQIVEAVLLLIIAAALFLFILRKKEIYGIPIYLICYGMVRFLLEYTRGDIVRGHFLFFSTSQWLSLIGIISGIILLRKDIKNSGDHRILIADKETNSIVYNRT